MSAATHPFPGRDPNQHPRLARAGAEDLLAELAAAVGSPPVAGDTSAPRSRVGVAPLGIARAGGANDLVVVGGATPRRRRMVVVATAVALAVALVVMAGLAGARADGQPRVAATTVLEGGDTLWGIAEDHTPADGDVRATVAAIMELNEFSTPSLPVGTPVRLPEMDR